MQIIYDETNPEILLNMSQSHLDKYISQLIDINKLKSIQLTIWSLNLLTQCLI